MHGSPVTSPPLPPSPGLATTHPRKLGDRETGGGLSLPVWIQLHGNTRLKNVPIIEPSST